MAEVGRRTFVLGLLFAGFSGVAEAKPRGPRKAPRGGKGHGGGSKGCGSRGGPGGSRDKYGKCPSWKK